MSRVRRRAFTSQTCTVSNCEYSVRVSLARIYIAYMSRYQLEPSQAKPVQCPTVSTQCIPSQPESIAYMSIPVRAFTSQTCIVSNCEYSMYPQPISIAYMYIPVRAFTSQTYIVSNCEYSMYPQPESIAYMSKLLGLVIAGRIRLYYHRLGNVNFHFTLPYLAVDIFPMMLSFLAKEG